MLNKQLTSFGVALATVLLLTTCCYGVVNAAGDDSCENIDDEDDNAETVICGRVASVNDGDTLRLASDADGGSGSATMRVRLLEIDAPELAQPHGTAARDALRQMAPTGSRVCVLTDDEDVYGRKLGRVCRGGTDLNLRLLAEGHAWCYRGRCRRDFREAEARARSARRGLWAARAQAPWLFRAQQRRREN